MASKSMGTGPILDVSYDYVTVTLNALYLGNAGFDDAIENIGSLTANQCTLSGGASGYGSIMNFGTFTLNQCTVSGCSSFYGALHNAGALTLNQCTLAGNGADYSGGIYNNTTGALTLNQCTLAGNSGGYSGGIFNAGALTLNQCTVSGNIGSYSGGIYNQDGTLTVNQSTLAGNYGGLGADISCYSESGAIVDSIVGDFGGDTSGISIAGPNCINTNPLVAPLGNYGGPALTMPPLPGSPAIDGCTSGTAFATDQRGYPRVVGLYADLGAVEGVYNPAGPGNLTGMERVPNGPASFNFTNSTDMTFSVLATTNLAWPLNAWTCLGAPVEAPAGSGHYQFTDPRATNSPQRFYRVTSP